MTGTDHDISPIDEPMIVAAAVDAGHDGLAEAALTVRYPNGAERSIALPIEVIDRALDDSDVTGLDQLVGRPWTVVAGTALGAVTTPPSQTPPAHHHP